LPSNNFPSSAYTGIQSQQLSLLLLVIGLALRTLAGFYGTITVLSPGSSVISLPNPFGESSSEGPRISLVERSTRVANSVGLGLRFIEFEQGKIVILSQTPPICVPVLTHSLSEVHGRNNLVSGQFLVSV
jgi:hypothetical protein